MSLLLPTLALTAQLCAAGPPEALAGIALYNPTPWPGPALVEVPTGQLATPGLLDWTQVHLTDPNGEEIPFTIREGRAHWRASLEAPPNPPDAEDLLVFWCAVPPGEWLRIGVVPGMPSTNTPVTRTDTKLEVRYDNLHAALDTTTGMPTALHVHGANLLDAPMSVVFHRVDSDSFRTTGAIGAGYQRFEIAFDAKEILPVAATLLGIHSTPAMTEASFVLKADGGPAMGLTYRFHAAGLVEVTADERPWEGASPWLDASAEFALPLRGGGAPLPMLEERQPFYGFKDHNAAFDQTALHRVVDGVEVLELGESIVNGRRWQRRIFAWTGPSAEDAVSILDEGLVVQPIPMRGAAIERGVRITGPAEAKTIVDMLAATLGEAGVPEDADAPTTVRFKLDARADAPGIERDGFAIRSDSDTVTIQARNLLGLDRATRVLAAHGRRQSLAEGIPLVAENPVVPLRGGGFGGGNFEVDFPYGSEENWHAVFDNLLDSGMNVFWCLGMWSNWKLPVRYKYMPELYSDDPKAYDESSGVLLSEYDEHHGRGLRLTQYLQAHGAPVYLWLPIGCVPTTFLEQYPEALKPGSVEEFWGRPKGTPCFTHPVYHRYVDAFLRELVETYPIDGVVLVRDDNGGVCDCERCKAFVEQSRTKSAVWEQYLQIYDAFRKLGFEGAIGVYPYFDGYTPSLDPLLPKDLIVAGHGASLAALARRHDRVGHMPDTWLDNLYTNFRLPSTPRVRRLLADRGTFWIGGAYVGTELPWEAVGHFGWQPTATPNSLRFAWGERTFGARGALPFLAFADSYEALWDINARYLVPNVWMALSNEERGDIVAQAEKELDRFNRRLQRLESSIDTHSHADWLSHVRIWPAFFEYHLRRVSRFAEVTALVDANRDRIDAGGQLPGEDRQAVLKKYNEIYDWAGKYRDILHEGAGEMLAQTRNKTMPYKEWMAGYDGWLDPLLPRAQFQGSMEVTEVEAVAGETFDVTVRLHNTGLCPWVERAQQAITFTTEGESCGLPERFVLTGEAIAPADTRELTFTCTAPETPGSAQVTATFYNPFRVPTKIVEHTFTISWKTDPVKQVTRKLEDNDLWILAPPKELSVDSSATLSLADCLGITCTTDDRQGHDAAALLAERLSKATGLRFVTDSGGGQDPGIRIGLLGDARSMPEIDAEELSGIGPEGYVLHVGKEGISLAARKWPGVFHGITTLTQLATDRLSLPALHLRDWPAMRYRGAQQDICRGQVPTMETFYRLVDVLAETHQNLLELYIEHTFHWESHPDISPPEGITPAEGRALFDYAARRHLEVHPLFQVLGHSYHILHKPQYQNLRIGPCEKQPWIMTFDIRKPEAVAMVNELLDELCKAFPGKLFNVDITEIDCDGMLEQGMTLEELTDLVFEYVLKLNDMVKRHDMRLMIAQGPLDSTGHLAGMGPKLDQLPKDIIVGSYYCAGGPYAPAWEKDFPRLQQAGIDFFAQAWIDSHTRLIPYVGHAADFSEKEVTRGLAHGAMGSITCDWGDAGNYHLTGQTWYPFSYHGAVAWAGRPLDRDYFNAAFTRLFHGVEGDAVARAIHLAGNISGDVVRIRQEDGTVVERPSNHFWEFFGDPFSRAEITTLADPAAEGKRILDKASPAAVLLREALQSATRNKDILDQLLFGAESYEALGRKLAVLAHYQNPDHDRPTVADELDALAGMYAALQARFRALWLAEDRTNQQLEDHCRRFDWTIVACRQKAAELRATSE